MLYVTRGWLCAATAILVIVGGHSTHALAQSSRGSDGDPPTYGSTVPRSSGTRASRRGTSLKDRLKRFNRKAATRRSTGSRRAYPTPSSQYQDPRNADPNLMPTRTSSGSAELQERQRQALEQYRRQRNPNARPSQPGYPPEFPPGNAASARRFDDRRYNDRNGGAAQLRPTRSPGGSRIEPSNSAFDNDPQDVVGERYGPNPPTSRRPNSGVTQAGYRGEPTRRSPPVRRADYRSDRFGDSLAREFEHSDFRSPNNRDDGSFSPVQPGMPSSFDGPNSPRGGYGDPRYGDPRSGSVRQAEHRSIDGVPMLTNDDAPLGTPAADNDDRMLLPHSDLETDAPPSVWDRWTHRLRRDSSLRLQRITMVSTTLAGGRDRIGMYDFNGQLHFAFPHHPNLFGSTGFQAHFLDGPTRTDMPPRLYNWKLSFLYHKPIKPGFALQLGLTPAIYTDFENTGGDAIRIMSRVVGIYTTSPQTRWMLGFVYLDREDVAVLPVIGVVHTPRDDLRIDLVFPRPKISKRLSRGSHYERWGYIAGEYGGGSWAIAREAGSKDIATYSDWRLLFGVEQRYLNGRSVLLELGYVFNRELEYKNGPGDFEPGDTFLLRAGLLY